MPRQRTALTNDGTATYFFDEAHDSETVAVFTRASHARDAEFAVQMMNRAGAPGLLESTEMLALAASAGKFATNKERMKMLRMALAALAAARAVTS